MQLKHKNFRFGFTLVELLIVMAIIAILAGLALSALGSARIVANNNRTRMLIKKLDMSLMTRYDEILDQRIGIKQKFGPLQDSISAKRELLIMELPDRKEEVVNASTARFQDKTLNWFTSLDSQPSPYFNYVFTATGGNFNQWSKVGSDGQENDSAECLYLAFQLGRVSRDFSVFSFPEEMVGDSDGDGMKEFLDAWGKPIRFIRWPVGHRSTRQPYTHLDFTDTGAVGEAARFYAGQHPEQTDPNGVLQGGVIGPVIYPLIYSAGTDGLIGYELDRSGNLYFNGANTIPDIYADQNQGQRNKASITVDYTDANDNITNHELRLTF